MARSINMTCDFNELPGRHLIDTSIINMLWDEGSAIFDDEMGVLGDEARREDVLALNQIMKVNRRAAFQLVVSPLSFAELANTQAIAAGDGARRNALLGWLLELTDHWSIMLDDIGDRASVGGTVRHRFKLTKELQGLEAKLLEIGDFRRDPIDRLLLMQTRMANCDAFLTLDENTIWKNRKRLGELGFTVLRPRDFWEMLKPWSAIWY